MLRTIPSLSVTARAAGLTAALVLGLTLGAVAPASAHSAGPPVAATAQDNEDATCDQAAAEAAVAAAEQQLEAAFRTNRHAIGTLRDKAGDENKAARDLLRQAGADLERIFAKAESALDVDNEDAEACTTPDPAVLDAIVATATANMEAVVTEVTAAVAALPADAAKADHEDEDN